jgi:unsaturated rhamnogalacturonyl hydrolase
MACDDRSSARLAAPPREPLSAQSIERSALAELGYRLAERTWATGLEAWSWGEGTCLLGLIRFSEALAEPFPSRVLQYLDRHAAAGIVVEHVNDLAPGTAAVLAARATGQRRYLDLIVPLVEWVRTAPRTAKGAIEHWPGSVWVDTVFMAGVFLGHAGAATADAGLFAELGRQLVAHAEVLQDSESGLFAHGSYRGETIRCFWGRGNAWWALAAVEFLELAAAWPAAPSGLVAAVGHALRRQLVALAALQPVHGVWDVLVDGHPETSGVLETSAAAGLGAAMLRAGAVLPDLPSDVSSAGWRAIRGALAYVDAEGTLTRVSAGTVLQLVPFGYSVIRDDRIQPWGQGLALHAVAAALAALARGMAPR